jgi:Tfp pilus assembly PilM family ATPase
MSLSGRRSPIGIEVGTRTVGAVQLDGSSARVLAAAVVARRPSAREPGPFETEEASRLESVLYRQGFVGRDVALCVPDGSLLTGVLELPPRSSGAPLEQLARVEMARTHKKDAGSFEMACWDLPAPARAGDGTHVMAAACMNDAANTLIDNFENAGFRVSVLDVKPWALTRACGRVLGKNGTTALLDVGETGAMLTAVRGGVPVYERLMRDAGVGVLRARLQKELALEPGVADYLLESLGGPAGDESQSGARESAARMLHEHLDRLSEEVRTALDYAQHRYPGRLELLGIMGPGAQAPGLLARISHGAEYPVRLLAPADLATCPQELGCCADPGLTRALGLAMVELRRAA